MLRVQHVDDILVDLVRDMEGWSSRGFRSRVVSEYLLHEDQREADTSSMKTTRKSERSSKTWSSGISELLQV